MGLAAIHPLAEEPARMKPRFSLAFALLVFLLLSALPHAAHAQHPVAPVDPRASAFLTRVDGRLYQLGKPFRLAGANNYYPMYVSQFMVDNLLETAAAQNFNAFRLWAFLDIGNADGTNSVSGPANGVYFHYWDGSEPAFNDGATGLQHLDYVLYRAGQLHLNVILPFVNNYDQFGGMDQYVRWAGGQFHDQFYTDPNIRLWYKQWISHLLNHTNIYNGLQYKNDPTIAIWELANEERCAGYGVYPQSPSCTTDTLTSWAADVSSYIKSIDPQHLVSSGSEGFYCTDPNSSDFTLNCSQGVDSIALAKLPSMDVISYHLYPDAWGKTPEWGTQWITQHIKDGHQLDRIALAGEWGLLDKNQRNSVYNAWENAVLDNNGDGALYWILSGQQDNGTLYPDYDGYTVTCPTPVCAAFSHFARRIQLLPTNNAPIADNDTTKTANSTPVSLNVTGNDITYNGLALDATSVDLDPSTPYQQTNFTNAAGTWSLSAGGNVRFQPTSPCTTGDIAIPYTVRDQAGRLSNPATITITVGGIAGELYNFEDGLDTWSAASFSQGAGTVAQSTNGATSCTHSLAINATATGGWFGPTYNAGPLPLSTAGVTALLFDITTTTAGTSQSVAVQFGSDYHFCSLPFTYQNANTSATLTANLQTLATPANCGGTAPIDTTSIKGLYVYFNGNATSYLDNVRTQ